MSDAPAQAEALNQQLTELLMEKEVDWINCLQLVERRDALLQTYLDANQQHSTASDESELRSVVEKSLEINKSIASRMQGEQDETEHALLKVNQGKKARASYE